VNPLILAFSNSNYIPHVPQRQYTIVGRRNLGSKQDALRQFFWKSSRISVLSTISSYRVILLHNHFYLILVRWLSELEVIGAANAPFDEGGGCSSRGFGMSYLFTSWATGICFSVRKWAGREAWSVVSTRIFASEITRCRPEFLQIYVESWDGTSCSIFSEGFSLNEVGSPVQHIYRTRMALSPPFQHL